MTPNPTAPNHPGRVMVVDDSAVIRRLLAAHLRQAGHDVVECSDGVQAMQAFRSAAREVVITDVSMPGLGGLDLLAELRRENSPPEVILLTGVCADDAEAAVQALRLGAHDYISKAPSALDAVVLAVARALEKRRLRQENERLVRDLRSLSLTDALTGLGNRRALDQALALEVARSSRHELPLSLVVFDLDHFKHVNDRLGHPVGDRLLASFARRLRRSGRRSDPFYRYGGEEFVALLPVTPLAGAERFAERVRLTTAARPLAAGGHQVPVTVSAGVAALAPSDDEEGLALFARADAALYRAKRQGRNQVATDGQEVPIPLPSGGDAPARAVTLVAEGRA